MDLNNEKLSAGERGELRSLLTGGVRRMKAARARRMRIASVTAAIVLVAGVVTGVSFAAGRPVDRVAGPVETTSAPSPTRSETPAPAPSPTGAPSSPTAEPRASAPFGGDCTNVLMQSELDGLRGLPMGLSPLRWDSGSVRTLGGLDCLWLSTEAYGVALVSVLAYPAEVVPASFVDDLRTNGCEPDGFCTHSGVVNGVWLVVRASSDPSITADKVSRLYEDAAARLAAFPLPARAPATAEWWSVPSCRDVAAAIDLADLGMASMDPVNDSVGFSGAIDDADALALGANTAVRCIVTMRSADQSQVVPMTINVIPGGAIAFETIADADGAQSVAVPGAQSAWWVPGRDRFDGSVDSLAVTDGVNVVVISDETGERDRASVVASSIMSAFATSR